MNRNYGSDAYESSEKIEAEKKKAIKRAHLIQRIVGTKGNRTPDQKEFMDLLAEWGWYNTPFSEAGPMPPEAVLNYEGMRSFFLKIKQSADYDFESEEEKAPKVDTSSQVGK
jgi:hypothetical protein